MLAKYIEDVPSLRVLDFLIDEPRFDFSKADVARSCHVSWKKADEIISRLEEIGVVEPTRQVSRARLYRIIKESDFLRNLISMDNFIMRKVTTEMAKEQMKKDPEKYLKQT